jgi:sugar/nucleoside kinase (ribokinase family)
MRGRGRLDLVVVGSVALDTIHTPDGKIRRDLLGGSVSYACAAASFFARTGMVGVVGSDFPRSYDRLYRRMGIDTSGLQRVEGLTFRWTGAYEENMMDRRTLATELNVFESFMPELPESYRNARFFLLGNIAPSLQLHVLGQARNAMFVAADTMDLWIRTGRKALLDVVSRVDLLTLNDGEARMLTGEHGMLKCARWILARGPRYVVIKKGEHGAMLFSRRGVFLVPAYPVATVRDPTGAGDSFAGAFMGRLAGGGRRPDRAALRDALLTGSVVASFGVEDFSLSALRRLTAAGIRRRRVELGRMIAP